MTTLSLAAMARMSAQETTPGHTFSTADLMASITSKPLTEALLGLAIFSPWKLAVLDEAVVEEEAEDGGAHALLPGDGGLHHRLDGVVHAGARVGVEAGG